MDLPSPPPERPPGRRRRAAAPPRAGRNLAAAVAVGLALGALILLSLYVVKVAFVGLALAAVLLAGWELANALGARGVRVPMPPVVLGTVAMLGAAYAGGPDALLLAAFLTVLAVLVWRLPEGPAGYVRDVTGGAFLTLYVPFLAGFAMLLLRETDGADRIVAFVLVTVCSDVGGYAVGVLIGRHPMAPTVSPKKTWEGFAGSALFSAVGGALIVALLLHAPAWVGVLLGLAAAGSATLGDLGESLLKRDLGVKDLGSLLPGHGGLMERLDSLVATAPVAWALLSLLVPGPR